MMLCLALTALLHADEPEPELRDDIHVDLLVRTTVPIDIGMRLQGELPGRLRWGVDVGGAPKAYINLVNDIVVSAGGYDPATALLIGTAIQRSFVVGADLGFRPWRKLGLQFSAGYQAAFAGGGLVGAETLESVSGESFDREVSIDLPMSTVLHMVAVDLSYEHVWYDKLVLRVDLGGAFTLWSQTRIESHDDGVLGRTLRPALDEGEAYIDDQIQRWLQTPTLGISLGFRFL